MKNKQQLYPFLKTLIHRVIFLNIGILVIYYLNVYYVSVATCNIIPVTMPTSSFCYDTHRSEVKEKTVRWHEAWSSRSSLYFDLYWPEGYASFQGVPFQEFKEREEKFFQQDIWVDSFYGEIHVEKEDGYWVSWFPQYLQKAHSTVEGIRRLYWNKDEHGELKVVGMKWTPQELDLEDVYLENVASRISTFIEKWRSAWEAANIDQYAVCYAEDSIQGSRYGKLAIVEHKKDTWRMRKPQEVILSGFRFMTVKDGIQVDMSQSYCDVAYKDKGIKTLLLRPIGNSWVIVREEWIEVP